MKIIIEDAGLNLSEFTNSEYSTDLTMFMYNEYGKIDINCQEIEYSKVVPNLTNLLQAHSFFDEIESPEAATDYFVENHNLIIDEYLKIKVDYMQNKTFRANLFQIVI